MKKLFFAVLVILLIAGCDAAKYSVSITNNSAKTVSYSYNGVSDSLSASEIKFYEVGAYTQPPKNIVDQHGIASLKMDRKDDSFTFIDAIPFDMKVINKLPVDITIKADNYIDNKGSIELTIDSGAENTDAKIYTKNPKFSPISDNPITYPITYEWIIIENKMSVIIR